MNGFLHDLRFGLRQLVGQPGFAAAAILTLALGIGANTAVFSVLSGYLFKPLPYPHPEQLIGVSSEAPSADPKGATVSWAEYHAVRHEARSLSAAAIYRHGSYGGGFNLNANGRTTHLSGLVATASLFKVLSVQPLIGQVFTKQNDQPGRGHVAVISYRLWQSRFGGKPDIVGTTVKVNSQPSRIIGVMPKGFSFPKPGTSIWVPETIGSNERDPGNIFYQRYTLVGRLKPGASLKMLRTELHAAEADIKRMVSPQNWQKVKKQGFQLSAQHYRQWLLGNQPQTLLLLQGAVLLVLVITCINVANLLLSRILGRGHELAMRSALGASRAVLARQLLVEGLWLVVPGGIAGVILAWLGLNALQSSALAASDTVFNIALDWRVGMFALSAVCVTLLLVSLLPISYLAKTDLNSLLQAGSRTTSGGRGSRRLRSGLVAGELTLATALLAAAGLLLHSFINLETTPTGFRKHEILIAGLLVPQSKQESNVEVAHFYHELKRRVDAMPGVETASIAWTAPFARTEFSALFRLPGMPSSWDNIHSRAHFKFVDEAYFKAWGIPILRGRAFGKQDTNHSRPVAIISESLAKRYFGNKNPVGQKIKPSAGHNGSHPWYTIVGVVPSIKYSSVSGDNPPVIYMSMDQWVWDSTHLVVHTTVPPGTLAKPLRQLINRLDPSIAVYNVQTIQQRLAGHLSDQRATMTLLLAFGGIALALAVVGVYGVMSYAVGQRRVECGVRLALGALPEDLLWLIIKDGLKLLGFGLAVGLGLAVMFGFVLSSRLFGIAPYDPMTLAGTIGVLAAITLIACYLPARRAAKLDPSVAMTEQ